MVIMHISLVIIPIINKLSFTTPVNSIFRLGIVSIPKFAVGIKIGQGG